MAFGETVSPVAAIQAILHDYPYSASILRELLQNSDDAGATKQIFVLDKGNDPALVAYNDSQFRDPDWQAIQSIHSSSKKTDTSKIGKYGVGFRACYHITDGPQILSGSSFAILDPLHSNGKKIDYQEYKASEYHKHFNFFSDISEPTSFPGTVIRLPLRSARSELSQRIVRADELHQMITDYIAEELNVSLLFLDNLKTIEIWETTGGVGTGFAAWTKRASSGKIRLAAWSKSERTSFHRDPSFPLITYDEVLSSGGAEYSWRIVQTQNSEDEAVSRLSKLAGDESVNYIVKKHKLRSDVRIAYPLTQSSEKISGRLFTFLPLPSKTSFPVHVHALFALTSSRQSLRNSNETGIVQGSDNDVLIKWNRLLFDHYIPQAWSYLLKTLADEAKCANIFSAWPPSYSSITSGDGLYWQDILKATFRFVIDAGLNVWPKVPAQGSATSYVDLKSALIVPRGKVEDALLAVLPQLGLTLVQLPQNLFELAEGCVTKLSPSVAHKKLQGLLANFENIPGDQRALVCRYLLSDKDIGNIFGLPLMPILSGSFVALSERRETSERLVMLTNDEAKAFKASAHDAILLGLLADDVAPLIKEQGPTKANADLLTPQVVIEYLTGESQPLSDERLKELWRWLGEWHLRTELITLLKGNSTLGLVPTTKGPQPASSHVFRALQDNRMAPLFGKLGLAFVTSVLPQSVVRLLQDHDILKNVDDLNDLLAAVNLITLPSLTDSEARSLYDHVAAYYGPLSSDTLEKLRKLPIYPVMVPEAMGFMHMSNSSTSWRSIHQISIKGVSPMGLIPIVEGVHFLDQFSVKDPSCSLLKKLSIEVLKDEDILSFALEHFTSQPKALQVAFVSYIRDRQYRLPIVKQMLQKTSFIRASDNSLQAAGDLIDPDSPLVSLFPQDCRDKRVPKIEDAHDQQLFKDFRVLDLMKSTLTTDLVQDRISYISSNSTLKESMTIARSLVVLMNEPNFSCFRLSIDPNMLWLPTKQGLVSSQTCINNFRRDTDLFDEVLVTLDRSISITAPFKALLEWDKPLPLGVLTEQLRHVLDESKLEIKSRKIRALIREFATRLLSNADVHAIRVAIADRPWLPTKAGPLAPHSRSVFASVPLSSGFHEVAFSAAEKDIYQFLLRMGCQDKPTAAAIIEELTALRDTRGDGTVVQRAFQLLELLPDFMTGDEYATVLVPDESGELVLLSSGICYYGSEGTGTVDMDTPIAHHLITEALAEKLRMNRLGLEVEDDIDLGEKPITTIRNTLKQYDPKQFFTEFVANASDAKAKQFGLLIDEHEGPTERLFSKGMKPFQSASLVVYNDGVFTDDDFKGIRETGIGGKRGKPDVIGHFGLGALSMFHFTELAMIVSNNHVLFLNPAKQQLGFRGRNAVLLELQRVKRLYRDHLEPLNGLFGFDLNSSGPYKGTLFRLPLRNQSHFANDPISTKSWPIEEIREMILVQFDSVAYKSLLFTALTRIDVHTRHNSQLEVLRSIESDRILDDTTDVPFKSEITTFKTTEGERRWFILSKPVGMPEEYGKILEQKYSTRHLLPVQIAAPLDDAEALGKDRNIFCALPLPVATSLPVHISAPFILEQDRRNVRLDNLGTESQYNRWLLTSEILGLYLSLLETLLEKQKTNEALWPPIRARRNEGDSMASQIIVDGFWSAEVLGASEKRIFSSRNTPPSPVSPKDAVLLLKTHPYFNTISKILDLSKPVNVVELPGELLHDTTCAKLNFIDSAFVKGLLEDPYVCQHLTVHEKNLALMFVCYRDKQDKHFSLDGLALLPLEDGSYATISESASAPRYYVIERTADDGYPPFRKERLVCEKLKPFLVNNGYVTSWKRILDGYNVSALSEEGIVELIKEFMQPADELLGDESHGAWVKAFWKAHLKISSSAISRFPLVQTRRRSFISLQKIDDSSIIVLEEGPSSKDAHIDILQNLGLTIVVREGLPSRLRALVMTKKFGVYSGFLNYLQKNPAQLKLLQALKTNEKDILSKWVRSMFAKTPDDFTAIACKLPVWEAQQGTKDVHLAALNDENVTILPKAMPSKVLRQFTDRLILDWDDNMKSVKKEPCSAQHITQLLRVSVGTLLRPAECTAYKKFIKAFVKLDKEGDYPLPVPNGNSILQRASDLFEQDDLFTTTFKSESRLLLSQDFQDLAEGLMKYGLKRRSQLNLSMFIECAQAFDKDKYPNKRARSAILYQSFNSLSLSSDDTWRCRKLDDLKFIPRVDLQRQGYGSIDTTEWMADFPPHVLAPSQITTAEYEPICWSQKGRTDPPPNPTLCGTYRTLGKPDGSDVLAHLKVLSEIAQEHGRHTGLLSDLKETYRWLNDHAREIGDLILQRNSENIFLNVDDPDKDDWVWHSASTLVMDLQDVGDMHDVKDFLRDYNQLLRAAAIRKIVKKTVDVISLADKTSHLQRKFYEMRQIGFGTDVIFKAADDQCNILPAHRVWLAANNDHLWVEFISSGFQEAGALGHGEHREVDVSDFSSACVKEVIDWLYVGELSEFLTKGNTRDEKERLGRLELGLDMLALCHKWEMTELHEYLQVFIINDPDFLNPYWVGRIREHAEETMANRLLQHCQDYEESNRSIMDELEDEV